MGDLVPDTEAAVRFLLRYRPSGPWSLTAIPLDQSTHLETAVFGPNSVDECRAWIAKHNNRRNVYFQVNVTRGGVNKRPRKQDMEAVDYLHVDIDPVAGQPIEQERQRIITLLSTGLPPGIPVPTFVIDSGGGFWALWQLDQPFVLNDAEAIEQIERYNKYLEQTFGADACSNVDRLSRLPGTINLPTAKKLMKGRQPALALVLHDNGRTYQLTEFKQAAVERSAGTGQSRLPVLLDMKRVTVQSLDELDQYQVPERIKIICAQGHHPDEGPKGKDDSRSAWLFDALCGMAKAGVPEEVMMGVITNEAFAISASILEKGRNAYKSAARQIKRALDHAVDEDLAELNSKHAVIKLIGGKTLVARIKENEFGRIEIEGYHTFANFKEAYLSQKKRIGEATMPLGNWWLLHPQRREYEGIVFDPSGDALPGYLNLWTGLAVEPNPGDWSLFRQLIEEVIAGGDRASADYIVRWIAWSVQNPHRPAEVALVLIGRKGTGKSTFANALMQLFAPHSNQVSSMTYLTGQFNEFLRGCCLLFADEAVWGGDKRSEGQLKSLITEPKLRIEAKRRDMEWVPNRLHIIIASNEPWVVPATPDERRYATFNVADTRRQDHDFFDKLTVQLASGGLGAMLHDLQAMELGNWHPRKDIPQTKGLALQQEQSLPPLEKAWHGYLMTGELPSWAKLRSDGSAIIPTSAFEAEVSASVLHKIGVTKVGDFLGEGRAGTRGMGFKKEQNERPRAYLAPPLQLAREIWDRSRFKVDWPHETEWVTVPSNREYEYSRDINGMM